MINLKLCKIQECLDLLLKKIKKYEDNDLSIYILLCFKLVKLKRNLKIKVYL